jgi:hypothetical protein
MNFSVSKTLYYQYYNLIKVISEPKLIHDPYIRALEKNFYFPLHQEVMPEEMEKQLRIQEYEDANQPS